MDLNFFKNIKDSRTERAVVIKFPNKEIVGSVTVPIASPLMIGLATELETLKLVDGDVISVRNKQDEGCELIDPVYQDANGKPRYVFLGKVRAEITKNIATFFYDNKYNDIFVIPNLEGYKYILPSDTVVIYGRAVGYLQKFQDTRVMNTISVTDSSSIALPEINKVLNSIKIKTVAIPGVEPGPVTGETMFEKFVGPNKEYNIDVMDMAPINLIELGTAQEVFGKDVDLPLYVLHQTEFKGYGIKSINVTSSQGSKLYLVLRF